MITTIENASLQHYNTFGIKCTCRTLITYDSLADLEELHAQGVFKTRWLHLGAGANTLFDCDHFDGVILHSECTGFARSNAGAKVEVTAENGWKWDDLVAKMLSEKCYGAENLSGIPASLGGAVVQNIGAYGMEISRLLQSVDVFDTRTGESRTIPCGECGFAYRTSMFKHLGSPLIVASARFSLSGPESWQPALEYASLRDIAHPTPEKLRAAVLSQRGAKLPDPSVIGNAGSFFVNPVVTLSQASHLSDEYPGMPQYPAPNGVKLAAAWLIEHAGLKGYRMGDAAVDDKNALVLVNLGHATGAGILALATHVANTVARKFGVTLKPEVNVIR